MRHNRLRPTIIHQRRRPRVKTTTITIFSLTIGMVIAAAFFGSRSSIRLKTIMSMMVSKSKEMGESAQLDRNRSSRAGETLIIEAWNAPLPPQVPDTVRCVILSDTHGQHEALSPLPKGDILIHLGDVANRGNLADIRSFRNFIQEKYSSQFRHVVLIEGNHDRELIPNEQSPAIDLELEYADFTFLRDQVVQVAGITMLGVSWDSLVSPFDHGFQMAQNALRNTAAPIDLVLSHMHSIQLERIVPFAPVHLFGHFHRQRGILQRPSMIDDDGGGSDKLLVNCASIPYQRPVVLDWNVSSKRVTMIHCRR